METVLLKLLETAGIPLAIIIAGWIIGKYVKPWVHESEKRIARAKEIALVADRITDELLIMFPTASWDNILDKAVDRIISSLDLSADVAKREAIHQLKSKMK